ncbi:hypothetical protein MPTK1_3g05220 [Marchantia polymorpha subsp. ruderalis]|uniref:Uncharacterized protein n=2 Tax=Marchantia polymorpha TaxID=3197 RepID=A0AAF6AXL8_MARPO|nr:hypothetical protein MARPO_0022s0006 [Marchantia polymorpha]BBN04502.1 hypothetical protein Mp_3g05220 [Marchantia polymorpha subsp. ruderalis]|eukprot:PTQ43898.1 hypothetical protein MARPO_0022s0006 [Marchantia polymorpha]
MLMSCRKFDITMMKFGAIPVYVKRIIIVELFILLVIVGYFGTTAGDSFIESKDFGVSEDILRSSHSGFAPLDVFIMKPFAVQGQQYHSRRRQTQAERLPPSDAVAEPSNYRKSPPILR